MKFRSLADIDTSAYSIVTEAGEHLVCARELSKALGLNKPERAYGRIDDKYKVIMKHGTPGGPQDMIFLTVNGVHDLINGRRKMTSDDRVVYFIECQNTQLIKIGISNNFKKRLRNLETMNSVPVKLLKIIPGNRDLESELHKRFAHLRHHGEWFRPGPDLMSHINGFQYHPESN